MNIFTPKKLPLEETIGEKMRQARHIKNLKVEDIARKIGIRPEYLIALEEERFDRLPAGLYGKNFLKEYAAFLKLDHKEILKNLNDRTNYNEPTDPFSQKIVKKSKFIIFPKIIRNTLIALAVLICFLYLIFYFKKIIFPPFLEITRPEKNLLTADSYMTITGSTEPEAEVKINQETVLNNNNGRFSQTVNLKKGLNNIIITAKKKYSRENTVTRQILVK
jgi:cytoskeletal protein RodZ